MPKRTAQSNPLIDSATGKAQEILGIVQQLLAEMGKEGTNDAPRLIAGGKVYEIAQMYGVAQRYYEQASKIDPSLLEATARLALVHLKLGNRSTGLMIAQELVQRNPALKFPDISNRPRSAQAVLGDAYRDNGNIAAAKEAYSSAVATEPRDGYSASKLAEIHILESDIDSALALTKQFLKSDELQAFEATVRLLTNDANRVPAIAGIVTDFARIQASHV